MIEFLDVCCRTRIVDKSVTNLALVSHNVLTNFEKVIIVKDTLLLTSLLSITQRSCLDVLGYF